MRLLCVGGPNDGEWHDVSDVFIEGDQAAIRHQLKYDPEAPVYLPWTDEAIEQMVGTRSTYIYLDGVLKPCRTT